MTNSSSFLFARLEGKEEFSELLQTGSGQEGTATCFSIFISCVYPSAGPTAVSLHSYLSRSISVCLTITVCVSVVYMSVFSLSVCLMTITVCVCQCLLSTCLSFLCLSHYHCACLLCRCLSYLSLCLRSAQQTFSACAVALMFLLQ